MLAPLYFPATDVGLGTAYERLAIYRLFDRWLSQIDVSNALEGPIDGMAGIGGVHLISWGRSGVPVAVELSDAPALETVRGVYAHLGLQSKLSAYLNPEPESGPAHSADVVLAYNSLPLLEDWKPYLARVADHSRRYMVVSVTSPFSYGVRIRQMLRRFETDARPQLFDHPSTIPENIEPELKRYGRILEHEFLDCPWWPDLFVDAGNSLISGTLGRLPFVSKFREGSAAKTGFRYGPESFPFFPDEPGYEGFVAAMARHPAFDSSGEAVARTFAHHHAYLIERTR